LQKLKKKKNQQLKELNKELILTSEIFVTSNKFSLACKHPVVGDQVRAI
jgi:hypothetical protein